MTHMLRCFAVALALPLATLDAQQAPVVQSGTRVRVMNDETVYSYLVVGTLESVDSSTIILRRDDGETVKVPRRPLTRLDVSTGPGSCSPGRRGTCVAIGALGGALLGVAAVIVTGQLVPIEASTGLAVTVPGGALVGAMIGGLVGGEHWKSASLPARLSLGPDGSGRFALGLSVRF
jgi:hypothetical protein